MKRFEELLDKEALANYIEITQDGIGRLLFDKTPKKFTGLYTEGLQTCVVIIIASNKGITLIHDTGKISNQTIVNEFLLLGNIEFWTVVYNPKFYPEKKDSDELAKKLGRYIEDILAITPKTYKKDDNGNMKLYEAKFGSVSISRDKVINNTYKHINITEPPNKLKRHKINCINNYFSKNRAPVSGDLQFNGIEFTKCSTFTMPLPEMKELSNLIKLTYPHGLEMIAEYEELYGSQDSILSPTSTKQYLSDNNNVASTKNINNNAVNKDSPINSTSSQELRMTLDSITPGQSWSINLTKGIVCLRVKNDEDADNIIEHFKKHGYEDIKKMYSVSTNVPYFYVLLTKIDREKLSIIPAISCEQKLNTFNKLNIS